MAAELAPPHSVEAEQAVLGALLLDCSSWPRIGNLTPQDFYRPDHRLIFVAISAAAARGSTFDAVVIHDDLKRIRGANHIGLDYLGQLVRDTSGTANIEAYAAKVRQYSLLRGLQSHADVVMRATQDTDDPSEILERSLAHLLKIQQRARTGNGLISAEVLAGELVDDLDRRYDGQRTGLATGLKDLDDQTHGLEGGDLVVFAGRPGFGKTTLLVEIALHVSLEQPAAVFSAEMPSLQVIRRTLASVGRLSQSKLRTAKNLTDDEWRRISDASTQIAQRRLWVDDSSAPKLSHIRSEALSLKARDGLGIVIVDYLQLMRGVGRNRYEELRDIAYGLKDLAKDLAVPVIALAQLNRGVETRDNKRPTSADLRDSGGIEEAADIIGLLYSQRAYDPEFAMPDVVELNVVKNRNGALGQCLWSMNGAESRIEVLDAGDSAQYRRLLAQNRRSSGNDL